ncbi:hypothetical protein [Streptomyces sp. NPDC052015]
MELFFDLCFVVAVAQASMSVHGTLTVGETPALRCALPGSSSPSGGRG